MAQYSKIANEVRKEVVELIYKGQTSHIGSCLSLADIATVIYENIKEEDRVVWSKGWAAALYYVLAIRKGTLDKEEVYKHFPNSPYLGLLEPETKGVYVAGGSMGHGFPVSVGMALAKKRAGEKGKVYCLMSDGELNEGTTWESALLASHHKLDNLVVFIDVNRWQAMGTTKDVLNIEPILSKFPAFGCYSLGIDGNNHEHIHNVIHRIGTPKEWTEERPLMITASTVKGKGISFMEDKVEYHYLHITEEMYEKAKKELCENNL